MMNATPSLADIAAVTDSNTLATQQIIQNDNANYRQLHDEIVANRMEDLKSKIADQAQEINQLNLSASMYTGCCNNNVAI